MDILILIATTLIALSMLLGKPLKIHIVHGTDNVQTPPVQDEKDPEEMQVNALNVMEKFNKEWSGLVDDAD